MNTKSRLNQLFALLQDDPNDNFLIYAIALEHVKNGDNLNAIELLQKLIVSDPEYLPAYYQLGLLYGENGQLTALRQVLTSGLKVAADQGDQHTRNEIRGLLDEYSDDE